MKRPLPIDTNGKSIARCGGSTQEGELLKWRNNTDINGSRSSSGKTRKKDVSRAGARIRDEGRDLLPGGQSCRPGSRKQHITHRVVPQNSISITPTGNEVVPKRISSSLA